MQKSMFISHGFAIHIVWNGERGRDQRGVIWFVRGEYAICAENEDLKFKLSEG
jgi:hypothetical protein